MARQLTTSEVPMTRFVDQLLLQGTTWEKLVARAAAEAKRRGKPEYYSTLREMKAHAKYRAKNPKFRVEMDDVGCRMNVVAKLAKPKAKPKAKAAKAKPPAKAKDGKAVGRRVTKKTTNGRQAVHPTDAEMKRDERDVAPTGQDA